MSSTIATVRAYFYPDFKPVYEIVRLEQDKIFIIPHVWGKACFPGWRAERLSFDNLVNVLIEIYAFHICAGLDRSIHHVRNGDYKLIFGFRNETSCEWKLVKYKFSHVGKGGGLICPSIWKYYFEGYEEDDAPEYSQITGFPSSSLLDDKAFLERIHFAI